MDSLLKKFRHLSRKYGFITLFFIGLGIFLVWPPNVGSAKTQNMWARPRSTVKISKVDSLRQAIIKTDSLINKSCSLLIKQQDTIKRLIKKQ